MNRHLRYVSAVGAAGAVYWLAAKVGLQLAYLHGSVAALWPPVGVGMASDAATPPWHEPRRTCARYPRCRCAPQPVRERVGALDAPRPVDDQHCFR